MNMHLKRLIFITAVFATASVSSLSYAEVSVSTSDYDYLYSKATLLKTEGNYEEAIKVFLSLTDKNLQLDRIYYQIASCYMIQKNFLLAKKFARKSIEQNLKFIEPYQLTHDIYMALRNYDDAAENLEELLASNPEQTQYHYLLGVLYFQNTQNYNLAAVSFKNILNIVKMTPTPTFYKEQSSLILSEIYYSQKDYQKSIDFLDKAVSLNPRNNLRFYRFATSFLSNGSLDLARRSLERFIANIPEAQKSNPLMKTLYAYMGSIYYITDHPQANYYLRLGSGDESIENFIAKQLFLLSTSRKDEALAALEKITISEYSSYIAPHLATARSKKMLNDIDGAYASYLAAGNLLVKTDLLNATYNCFLEAHKLKPSEQDPIISLAQVSEQMGNLHLAAYYFSMYNEKWPDIEINLHVAYLYDMMGNTSKSDSTIASALTSDASYPRLYFVKGLISNKREKYSEAERDIKKAISLKADDHNYYYYLAIAQEKTSKFDDAISSLVKALEYDKQNASYQNFLGYLYADKNINLGKAEELLDSALKQEPFNGAFLDSIGWIYYRQGKFDDAIKKLMQAMRNLNAINESDPVVYDHIGDTYFKLGKKQKAIEFWKQSLSIKPSADIQKKIDATDIN
jgi:tetratricopeptide (TPR) repeat protein